MQPPAQKPPAQKPPAQKPPAQKPAAKKPPKHKQHKKPVPKEAVDPVAVPNPLPSSNRPLPPQPSAGLLLEKAQDSADYVVPRGNQRTCFADATYNAFMRAYPGEQLKLRALRTHSMRTLGLDKQATMATINHAFRRQGKLVRLVGITKRSTTKRASNVLAREKGGGMFALCKASKGERQPYVVHLGVRFPGQVHEVKHAVMYDTRRTEEAAFGKIISGTGDAYVLEAHDVASANGFKNAMREMMRHFGRIAPEDAVQVRATYIFRLTRVPQLWCKLRGAFCVVLALRAVARARCRPGGAGASDAMVCC